jgi:hypothetical protein
VLVQKTNAEEMTIRREIRLSNGSVVSLSEGDNSLSLALMDGEEVGSYICELTVNGVLTYPNSGDAVWDIVEGLREVEHDEKEFEVSFVRRVVITQKRRVMAFDRAAAFNRATEMLESGEVDFTVNTRTEADEVIDTVVELPKLS